MASGVKPWQVPVGSDAVVQVPPASTLRMTDEPLQANSALPLPMMKDRLPATGDHDVRSGLENVPHDVTAKAWLAAKVTTATLQFASGAPTRSHRAPPVIDRHRPGRGVLSWPELSFHDTYNTWLLSCGSTARTGPSPLTAPDGRPSDDCRQFWPASVDFHTPEYWVVA